MSENKSDMAFSKFRELAHSVFESLTEADTRAKLIEPLFKECLGWTEENIARETHVHKGFIDYVFSVNGFKKFVLEAKEVGSSFEIPSSMRNRKYRIDGTISTDKRIQAAIEQAQRYCVEKGILFGIVSNGRQYIIFESFKFGDDWRSGRCIVFRSLEDIEKNFVLFWNLLSRNSVVDGSLKRYVSDETPSIAFQTPLDQVHAKDSPLARNNLSPTLEPILEYVFGDLIADWQLDVLKWCYVRKKEYEDTGQQLGRHFDRPPSFAGKYGVQSIAEMPGIRHTFEELYDHSEEFLRTSAPRGNLILLMGGVGCGKTTFIHHFFNFVIGDRKETIWFYVDFTNAPPQTENVEEYIYRSILDDFDRRHKDKLREFRQKLTEAGIGLLKPDKRDIMILFSELMLKGFMVSLVLDNADQHAHLYPKFQEYLLQMAKNLTNTLRTMTIVTLREESFFKSTMSGVLDAFIQPTFHLASPSFEHVVRTRLNYALQLLKMKDEDLAKALRSPFKGDKVLLTRFFSIVENSLRSSRPMGTRILQFMNEVSGGNMREALDFFRTFLTSGNTNIDEMLKIDANIRRRGQFGYQIPFHHVIKSIILEHSQLYSQSRSRVMNLFDLNPQYTNSHFLSLKILKFLHDKMSYETIHGPGYVEIDIIIRRGEEVSISRNAIAWSLKRLAYFGLVQFENQSNTGYDSAAFVRITNTGVYYLKELIHRFVYVDLVWIDTPLADPLVVKELMVRLVERDSAKASWHLEERLDRTNIFLGYLSKMEEREFAENPEYRDSALAKTEFIPAIRDSYKTERQYIEQKRQ
jgi:hypothetical protein